MGKLSKASGVRPEPAGAAIWSRDEGAFVPFPDDYEIAMAKERAIQKAAVEHNQSRPGHELKIERDIRCHFQVKRSVCQCGWEGEWYRITSTN